MKINNVSFDFDATSLEGIKAVEEAFKKHSELSKKSAAYIKQGRLYDAAVLSIEAVKDFFISLVNVDVVGECNSPVLAAAFIEDFQKQCEEQRQRVKKDYFK